MNTFWRLFTLGGLIIAYLGVLLAKLVGFCGLSWLILSAPVWIIIGLAILLFLAFWLYIALVALIAVIKFKLFRKPSLK